MKKRGPRLNLRMKSISLDSPEPHFDENTCLKGRNLSVPRVVESYHSENNRRVHNSWVNVVRNRMHLNSSQSNRSRQQQHNLRLNCGGDGAANSAPASYNHCNHSSLYSFDWLSSFSHTQPLLNFIHLSRLCVLILKVLCVANLLYTLSLCLTARQLLWSMKCESCSEVQYIHFFHES